MRVAPPRRPWPFVLAVPAALLVAVAAAADVPRGLATSGVALVPADAAFLSATLRVREQYDRFVSSNAWAALRSLPVVKRGLESLAEQRSMPGSPVSLADALLSLPENAETVELLADMVATDTFVYGEPTCVAFVSLLRKLSAVVQAIIDPDLVPRGMLDEEFFEDVDDGEAAARRAPRRMLCQIDVDAGGTAALQKRMIVQTLVDNIDLLVMPDVVWGFRTTKADLAKAQLARLEKLVRSALDAQAADAVAIERHRIAGGDFLVLTIRGTTLPWGEIEQAVADAADDIDGFDEVVAKLRKLDLCMALGLVGDWVILSFGDSTDHLVKFANGKGGLLGVPALAPVAAHADKKLTAVSYASADMVRALSQTADDMVRQVEALEAGLGAAGVAESAVEEMRDVAKRFATAMAARLPEPGAWTGFSWLTDSGYEGQTWDRSRNQPFDGSRRLDLLDHAGGAPLAVLVTRLKSDPKLIDDVSAFVSGLWSLFQQFGPPSGDVEDQVEALAGRLADVLRDKILAALADGQVGLVLDAKSRTKKPQDDLPASADPLPLPELGIVLPLKDAKLLRDGLNDLFALGYAAASLLRGIDPDAVPGDSLVPDPEKTRVGTGTVWSFPLPKSGLDEQVRPAIGVGEQVAVFSLAPKQAGRLLEAAKLETGAGLAAFEEPLAGAAAVDFAGVVDAVKPWIAYLTRYGCVRDQEGTVEADAELGADDETEQARDALGTIDVVLEVAKCLRAAAAETSVRDGAVVTRWRNVIRDLPKQP